MTGSGSKPVAGENDLAQNPFDLAAERGPRCSTLATGLSSATSGACPSGEHRTGGTSKCWATGRSTEL